MFRLFSDVPLRGVMCSPKGENAMYDRRRSSDVMFIPSAPQAQHRMAKPNIAPKVHRLFPKGMNIVF